MKWRIHALNGAKRLCCLVCAKWLNGANRFVGIWSMGGVAHEIHNVEVATAGPMESMYLSRTEDCVVLL